MWFLILQIFVLFALAAAFGAWLMHWWLTRRQVDVTEEYHGFFHTQGNGLTREDLDASMRGLTTTLGNNFQQTDLSGIESRLHALEASMHSHASKTDIEALTNRLGAYDSRFTSLSSKLTDLPTTDASTLVTHFDRLNERLSEPASLDFSALEARLEVLDEKVSAIGLPTIETPPDVDLGPLHAGLTRLELSLGELQKQSTEQVALLTAPEETDTRLDTILERMTSAETVDLSSIEKRLVEIEEALSVDTTPELEPIHASLARLETAIQSIDVQAPETDFSPLQADLAVLQSSVSSLPSELSSEASVKELESLKSRMADMSTLLSALRMPDLTPFTQRFDDIEHRISEISIPAPDMTPLNDSLSFIHGKLAELEVALTEKDRQQNDLTLLQQRLEQMQADLSELSRLEQLENMLGATRVEIQQRSTVDTSGLEQQLAPLASSVHAIKQRMDSDTLDARLASIEHGLAVLHHMMWSNSAEITAQRLPAQSLDTPRIPAQQSYYTQSRPDTQPPPLNSGQRFQSPTWPPAAPAQSEHAQRRDVQHAIPPQQYSTSSIDKIRAVRRPGDEANLLTRPAFGAPDPLEQISGVGPTLHDLLTDIGVYYFWQIADWGPREVAWVDGLLDGFNGRIERDDWVGQARSLAVRPETANRP